MKDDIPMISCIMPAYNAESFLREAIDSILKQSFEDFELIIINDGSNDSTESIIMSYNDPRIVYLRNEHNLKLIKTLNKGIDVARGRFISRMDSDDIALPDMFRLEIDAFNQYKDATIINTLTYHLSEDGTKIRKNRLITKYSPEALECIMCYYNLISHPGVMVKGEWMRKYRYSDIPNALHTEDTVLWHRMLMNNAKCYTLDIPLLKYRVVSNSINNMFNEERKQRVRENSILYTAEKYRINFSESFKSANINSLLGIFYYLQSIRRMCRHCYQTNQINSNTYREVRLFNIKLLLFLIKNRLMKFPFIKQLIDRL